MTRSASASILTRGETTSLTESPEARSAARLIRPFLITLIGSLSIAGVMAIVIVLSGNLGETEARILGTTVSVAAFSLTGLAASLRFRQGSWTWVGVAGIAASALALLLTLLGIWTEPGSEALGRTLAIVIILATALAYASVMLLVTPQHRAVATALLATLAVLAGVTGMLIALALSDFDYGEWFFRVLGALAILAVLGTLVTPLLNRVLR